MATVIIPAHNEATVIRRCLDSIKDQAELDTLIVACNGCTDNTADIVRNEYPQTICLDIGKPSKVNALNEAEQYITSWPVFYIDADTHLSPNAIAAISTAMAQGDTLLAAPEPEIDTSKSSWAVRQFYRIWLQLPYIRDGVIATCSYVVSKEGHQRFEHFPEVINDDGFVRCQFDRHERRNIPGTKVYISAPHNLSSLIKIKTRARLGNMQLAAAGLCTRKEQKPYANSLKAKLFSKEFLPTFVYLSITLLIRLRAARQYHNLASYQWEKDQTSR